LKLTIPKDAPNYPTILHALESVATRTPDRMALICEDRSLTFAQYEKAMERLQADSPKPGETRDILRGLLQLS